MAQYRHKLIVPNKNTIKNSILYTMYNWLVISYCYLSQLLANYPYLRNVNTRLLLFNAEAYNDLIEYQFNNIVKLMSGLGMGESIQEKVLKELSTNLASLMAVENWGDEAGWCYPPLILHSQTPLQVKSPLLVKQTDWWYIFGSPKTTKRRALSTPKFF